MAGKGKSKKPTESPMMRQWQSLKNAHADSLLLFRMGDFYETFNDDAKVAARALGITLTNRGKSSGQDMPLAGFPYHKLEPYLARLVRAGIKVAIAEQIEDPKLARGLVERDVTRIVTAGTLTEEALLDERRNNYLAALATGDGRRRGDVAIGLAWVDLSTGEFAACDLSESELADELARLSPSECLVPGDEEDDSRPAEAIGRLLDVADRDGIIRSTAASWTFADESARRELLDHFKVQSLAGFGCEELGPGVAAAGALLRYLRETQLTALHHIVTMRHRGREGRMNLDRATLRTLEITETLRGGDRKGSLIDVVDRTRTAMGARRLRSWLLEPLVEVDAIQTRQDCVAELVEADEMRARAREALGCVQDLERLSSRVSTGRAGGRDLLALRDSARALPELAGAISAASATRLALLRGRLDALEGVEADIARTLRDEVPTGLKDGDLIREGHDEELDELRAICSEGTGWMARFQAEEIRRSGIQTLKVGYTSVFGYYIEVTHANTEKVPETYIRKQTLKNAERYITPELKEYEEKVLSARERAHDLEYRLFGELRDRTAASLPQILATAEVAAEIDVLASFAELARHRRYVRPQVDDSRVLDIREGRHPVLEVILDDGSFVPNDLLLDEDKRVMVLTGPNMAGKSTYIRQAALLVLLAQVGAFVPAASARVGVADRIFTRIGAADELARGASTFMVEMSETANILNHATERSLVILDEVGRGTSTYDGVAIAWAITEHLHDQTGARTLFATHYHELTALSEQLSGVLNCNVAVRERGDEVAFLHRIQQGGTDRSYGIHVARLAGIPLPVIERARHLLQTLTESAGEDLRRRLSQPRPGTQGVLFTAPGSPVEDRVRGVEPDSLSPRQALELLYELRDLLGDD